MEKIKKYICPMGCVEPQSQPGNCEECGMKLVEIEEDESEPQNHHYFKNHSQHEKKHKEYNKHAGHKAEDFIKKFWLSLVFSFLIIFLPKIFPAHISILNYLILILASFVFFYGGWVFIVGAYKEIKFKNPGMMTLIGVAIVAAYFYSIYATFLGKPNFFWEFSSLITIMLLGHYFEMRSVSFAQSALKEIEKLLSDVAELEDGRKIKLEELKIGDIVVVRPGSKIPADGVIIEGKSEINESMITGESKPVLKEKNSEVIAGTINGDGFLKIKVNKIGEETFLAGIKKLIKEAQFSKSKLQVLADIFAKYLTFIALGVGALSFILWIVFKNDFAFALERLVTVLVIACPHALGLAVPLVVAISTSLAIHNGFLIKNRVQMELARKINIVLFDKTGTLTTGEFKVKEIQQLANFGHTRILQIAASLNQYSEHFIAKGILEKAKEENIEILPVKNFENLTGRGVKGEIENKIYYLGGENLLKELDLKAPQIEAIGTVVYLISEKNILGAMILEDEIKAESKEVIQKLHNFGIKTAMITGDKKEIAEKVAEELGVDEYFAEVLPQQKIEKVKELQNKGLQVMMVGDGINDAPALIQADVGVAVGAGTNVAIESAGIILIKNNPEDIVKLLKLSKLTYKKMVQNLFWATGYNVFALPLAAGILANKGILLPPSLAAIFMSLSTIIVAFNALMLKRGYKN